MRRLTIMRRIVLPQAMRVIVPPTGNEINSMLKNTSLVSMIGIFELFRVGPGIFNANYKTIPLLHRRALVVVPRHDIGAPSRPVLYRAPLRPGLIPNGRLTPLQKAIDRRLEHQHGRWPRDDRPDGRSATGAQVLRR